MAAPELNRQVHGIDRDLARGVRSMHICAPAKLASQQELKMEMDATSVKEALVWLEKLTGEPVSGPIAVLARAVSLIGLQGWTSGRRCETASCCARP